MPHRRSVPARPRRGAPDDTRQRLVAAAATVFNRDGYHATDSNRIARAAGYAPGTFYRHFPDKRSIFLAVYDAWVTAEWDGMATRLAGSTDAPRTIVAHAIAYHRRWRGVRASLHALVATDPIVRRAYQRQRRRQLGLIAALRTRLGQPAIPPARAALLLYLLERTCDAIAHGEPRTLGLTTTQLIATLRQAVAWELR